MDGSGENGGLMDADEIALRDRLEALIEAHKALDAQIHDMAASGADALVLQRLKRSKLRLKDEIGWIIDQLEPDIIA